MRPCRCHLHLKLCTPAGRAVLGIAAKFLDVYKRQVDTSLFVVELFIVIRYNEIDKSEFVGGIEK